MLRAFFPGVSLDLTTPVWRLAYGIFNKNVFGLVALFDNCLNQVHIFTTRASCAHDSMALSCVRGFKCGYINTGNSDHDVPSHGYLEQGCSIHRSRLR
jgi:hypothetical protein